MAGRWRHLWTLAAGAAGWSAVDGHWWAFLVVFAAGLVAGVCSVVLWKVLRRAARLAEAVERRIVAEPPLHEDDDYLDGVERGIRSARRSAGHEDGRMIELDRMNERSFP